MRFSSTVQEDLKYYVYLYSHPLTGEIFYVGKGKGNRVFSHLEDKSESHKVKYLSDLRRNNLEPRIEILVHGLEDDETALRVESSVIDLIGIKNLTNIQSGYKSSTFGRMTIDQVKSVYEKREINIDDRVILIRISKAFRYTMSDEELYEYTRGRWKLNPERAKNAKYGFAVYEGIVQEVYEIADWYKAGTTDSFRSQIDVIGHNTADSLIGRYEFVGRIAPQIIRDKYRFTSVRQFFARGNSNPITYVNVER
jgi:uncharacterized protein